MKLSELYDLVLLEIGQYQVEDLIKEEIPLKKFFPIAKSCLDYYTKYRPVQKTRVIYISGKSYEFINDLAPLVIDRVVSTYGEKDLLITTETDLIRLNSHIPTLREQYWRYEKPLLITGISGLVSVRGYYNYEFVPIPGTDDYNIPDLDMECNSESKLIQAKLLMTLGRSRRSFTMSEIPINTDASELYSEGNQLWESTKESIQTSSKWYVVV